MMTQYISQEEMAKRLNKSKKTIRLWVENGMVTPVNPDTNRRDGGYRFTEEEYERLSRHFAPDTLSLKAAASLIGITKQYLNMLATATPPALPSQMISYGKQQRRVFGRADCITFKESMEARAHTKYLRDVGKELSLYKNDLRLFDSFTLQNQRVVVVSVDPIRLLSENNFIIEPIGAYPVSESCLDLPYQKRPGVAVFVFPKPNEVGSPIFGILSRLVEDFGTKNIRIFESEHHYLVRCRHGRLKGTSDDIQLLEQYKKEGTVSLEGEYIELSGQVTVKRTLFASDIYKRIEELANENEASFDDIVNQLLNAALNGEKKQPNDE